MKYASFIHQGRATYGAMHDDRLSDLGAVSGAPGDLLEALESGALSRLKAECKIPLESVKLLPVIRRPQKIFCVGHNYEMHRQETGRAAVGHPSIFLRFADTLNAHGAEILRPIVSDHLDYEGELAVIIGKPGRHIVERDAMSHVAGFSCANDASVRDWQWHTQQFTPGKNFPTTAPLGPWLVTLDEVGDISSVSLTTRLNGQVMQHATLADLIFPIPVIIGYLSTFTPLNVGDVILTGTPGGVGAKRQPPVWMRPGDVVEVEISNVGVLRNTIGQEE